MCEEITEISREHLKRGEERRGEHHLRRRLPGVVAGLQGPGTEPGTGLVCWRRPNATITTLQLDRENKYRTHISPLSGGMLGHLTPHHLTRNMRGIFRHGDRGMGGGGPQCGPAIYSFISFNNLLIM